jgi:hypothetical protein
MVVVFGETRVNAGRTYQLAIFFLVEQTLTFKVYRATKRKKQKQVGLSVYMYVNGRHRHTTFFVFYNKLFF